METFSRSLHTVQQQPFFHPFSANCSRNGNPLSSLSRHSQGQCLPKPIHFLGLIFPVPENISISKEQISFSNRVQQKNPYLETQRPSSAAFFVKRSDNGRRNYPHHFCTFSCILATFLDASEPTRPKIYIYEVSKNGVQTSYLGPIYSWFYYIKVVFCRLMLHCAGKGSLTYVGIEEMRLN